MLYLLINICSVSIPYIFSFHRKINFQRQWHAAFPAILITALCFVAWDIVFTERGIWGFNPDYISGLYLFNLPVEEVLFFICIPYACLFTYHCLSLFFSLQWKTRSVQIVCITLALLLMVISTLYMDRAYTFVTFISTAVLLLLLQFVFKVTWLGKLFSIYPVLLIPFFIVNGILTGTGPDAPVVWYNDAENMGIRLLTIPVEDVVYGFELIMLNVLFFERWRLCR